jgi:predicted ATPase
MNSERFFVLTGGPGSGKTSLIEALGGAGHSTAGEAGRAIIQDQMAIDGPALPWRDPAAFAELMLAWDMRSHRLAQKEAGPVFFDRRIPDVLGYLLMMGRPVPPHMAAAASLFRYNRRVFIAPPWPEIFRRDRERRQSLDEAERTYEAAAAIYGDLGYELIELPRLSVAERLRFIIARID